MPVGGAQNSARNTVVNVPNALTLTRLGLSIVLFVFLAYGQYLTSFVLFVVAASTDWLDGYYARKYGQVTMLGRIMDPFVDKVIVCGTFVFLAAIPTSGIRPWMAVVIFGREMLVTALRSYLEQQGQDFSAQFSGKLKMALQCVAASISLFSLHWLGGGELAQEPWLGWLLTATVWAAVFLTIYSGVTYARSAWRLLMAA